MAKYDTINGWIIYEDGTRKKWFDSILLSGHMHDGARIWPGKFLKENLISTMKKAFHGYSKIAPENFKKTQSRFVVTAVLENCFQKYFKLTELVPSRRGQKVIFNIQGTKFVFNNVAEYPSANTWTFVEIEQPDTITVVV